ncbi:MAG: hypothetical protein E7620_04785 [Ruminococcaceae bacterium]|nr:hypothetical protein [Oscillospiraceae bacterium]
MSDIRERLINRERLLGCWIQTGSPSVGEIFAEVGYDWIAIDMEHSDIHIHEFTQIARAIYGRGPAVFARVRENDTLAIRQVLDMGADGVIVPLVNNAEDARRAVAAAKYPPLGVRGFGYARMNQWGKNFDAYAEEANDRIAVIVMIESREAVEHIDEILEVEGVDGVLIGPYDMSGSYGLTGQTSHPIVVNACKRVAEACLEHHRAAGQHIVLPTREKVQRAVDQGFSFIALGCDLVFLRCSAENARNLFSEDDRV